MIFRKPFLEGIQNGTITLAFRQWEKPFVKAGGTLLTKVGQLLIGKVTIVEPQQITARDAKRAGFPGRDELIAEVAKFGRPGGSIYRIELKELRPDPRIALRSAVPESDDEVAALVKKLERLDAASPIGPWTRAVLDLIDAHPERRAGDLCKMFGQEMPPFKINVRKLKRLGLTESLKVGYRLSPRGVVVHDALRGGKREAKKA